MMMLSVVSVSPTEVFSYLKHPSFSLIPRYDCGCEKLAGNVADLMTQTVRVRDSRKRRLGISWTMIGW